MKKSLYLVLLINAVLGILFIGLLTHQRGPYLVLAQIAYYMDDRMTFDAVEGRFIDGFQIQGFSFEPTNGEWIKADNIKIDWQPFKIFLGKFQFDTVNIDGLYLEIDTEVVASQFEHSQLLPIQINQLHINQGIWQTESQQFEFNQADCRLRMNFFSLYCDTFTGIWENGKIAGQFKYQFRNSELAGSIEIIELGTEYGTLQANTEIIVKDDSLHLKGEASHPIQGEFEITLHDLFHQPHWNAEVDCTSCLASALAQPFNHTQIGLSAVLSGEGTFDTSFINIDTDISVQTGIKDVPDLPLHVTGKIEPTEAPAFDLTLTTETISWPLQIMPNSQIQDLQAQLTGVPENYRLTGKAMLTAGDVAIGELFIAAAGTQNSLHISRIELQQGQGKLLGSATIHKDSVVHTKGSLKLDQIDLSTLNPLLHSMVDAVVDFRGSYTNLSRTLELEVKQASGSWKQIPLQAEGKLSLINDELNIHDFRMRSADASLVLTGSRKQYWNIDWSLDIPTVNQLTGLGQGKLNATGKIRGTRQDPTLLMQLQSPNLKWGTISLHNSLLEIDWGGKESNRSQLVFSSESVSAYETEPFNVTVKSFGHLQRNIFHIEFSTLEDSVNFKGEGRFTEDYDWHGIINSGLLHSERWGHWQLSTSTPIEWKSFQLTTERQCWQNLSAEFCLTGFLNSNLDSELLINFSSLPIHTIAKDYLANIELPGSIDGSLVWKSTKQEASATLNASLPSDDISFIYTDKRRSTIQYRNSELSAEWQPTSLTVNLNLNLLNEDYLRLKVHSPTTGRPDPLSSLEAELAAHLSNLKIFENALPQLEEFTGQLDGKVSLTNNLIDPKVVGSVTLNNFGLFIPDNGIYLADSQLEAHMNDETIVSLGILNSGEGWAKFDWNLNRMTKTGQLNIEGKNFKVMDLPYATIALSPKISGQYAHRILNLNGNLYIDHATLLPPKLTLAIRPSSDIRETSDSEDTKPDIRIHSNLSLELSDDVYFSGFNISGYLTGNLELQDRTEQYTIASGRLSLRDGLYQALDSQLEITEGYFMFNGQSIFDPVIRIKASRQIESGMASLVAKGSLLAPEIDIQAGPDDSKADALAYVLLGRKLDEESTEEGEQLYAAAVTMGIRGGQYIARQIQSRLALDSVRVDDDRSTRKTSLLLSKYVTPNLLVTYGIGLFNSARNLNLLYNLDEYWAVEGNVGRESGADLLFSQEF